MDKAQQKQTEEIKYSSKMLAYERDQFVLIGKQACSELINEAKIKDINIKAQYYDNCMSKVFQLEDNLK